MNWRWLTLCVLCGNAAGADLRQDILQAVFPAMEVVATTRHRSDLKPSSSLHYTDAFANEPIYQVNGLAINEVERCASEDLSKRRFSESWFSKSREVQLQIFPWPRTRADLAAVVQYRFIGASPAGSCWSIGLVLHISRRGQSFEVLERQLMEPMHHSLFATVRLVDLNGDGVEELVVEPDAGGVGSYGTSMLIFDLSGRRLRPILETQSRLEYMTSDRYLQELDVERTLAQEGQSVCFELTVFAKDEKIYSKPHVSHECYPMGTGVDEKQAALLNQGLRPLEPKPHP
jgi:hypothetical protein